MGWEQCLLEIAISTNEIIAKLLEIDPKKDNSFYSFNFCCYCFSKRNSYGIRAITYVSQKIKESCKQEYSFFLLTYTHWDSK